MKKNLEALLPKPRVIFRADGNSKIGLGHVTRSLALATYLKGNFECIFAIQKPAPEVLQQLNEYTIHAIILPISTDLIAEAAYINKTILQASDILVLDGYNFNLAYQEIVKEAEITLICIDDIHAYSFVADAIINTAGGVNPANYQALPDTKYYLGPEYAFLREPFLEAALLSRKIKSIRKIFLNMGGADPENHTVRIIQDILKSGGELQLEVVIGSAYRHAQELNTLVANVNSSINIHQNLNAEAMCALMQQCQAAILPPSSVSYEWCSVSGPLFLHQTADNQKQNQTYLLKNNLAFPLERFSEFLNNPEQDLLIAEQIRNQRKWFNGQSPQKLRAIFLDLYKQHNLKIRRAEQTDSEQLFEWANDTEVRQNSFNPEPISWEVHQIWFKNKLRDPNCLIYIAEVNKIPAGMVRFDMADLNATISYLIDPKFRGKGLGTSILEKGLTDLKRIKPSIQKAIGFIQENNIASIKAFEKNHFVLTRNLPAVKAGSLVFEKNLK